MKKNNDEGRSPLFTPFRAGVIALVFLIIGFQTALFIYKGAELRILANRDEPDTVFVYEVPSSDAAGSSSDYKAGHKGYSSDNNPDKKGYSSDNSSDKNGFSSSRDGRSAQIYTERHDAGHSPKVEQVRENTVRRKVETFRFDPNTASTEELERLGFSPKQAAAIDNYRKKGGRFRRKEDFAKSYVVSDSIYRRLEPCIYIPLIDINLADSAAFDSLPGIGGYFAAKMVSYREQLGGYSCKEQLMEIYHFDRERYDALQDLITLSEAPEFRLWSLPVDSLRLHPHIKSRRTADAIVLYRENNPLSMLTVEGLRDAGILSDEQASGLSRCNIAPPKTGK